VRAVPNGLRPKDFSFDSPLAGDLKLLPMFSIGEFSRISGITVKALRFYHEQGLLVPSQVDPRTGYRYYDWSMIDRARAIVYLRQFEFSLEQIKEILADATDEDQLIQAMQRQRESMQQRIREMRLVVRSLDEFISDERQAKSMSQSTYEIQEKTIDPILIAGIRMKGRYDECGKGFSRIGRSFGRWIAGPAMMLHYDKEYKETDADFEAAMPIKQAAKSVSGIDMRQLPAVKCVTLVHQGPYDQLGSSYARVFKHVNEKGYKVISPTREVYLKGPGMIFKGNPKKYLTEIQIPVEAP
jgi:DNA-binding transcriptional MerR regulator/predicted transcriptional regulator YdeE